MILLGKTRQTKLTFKLDYPGNLCRVPLVIFAKFQILIGIPLQFQSTSSAIKT